MSNSNTTYWMSREELAGNAQFQERLREEFPRYADVWKDGLSRRTFLQLMGASLALAGLNGCTRPPANKIVPYTDQPEQVIPGRPLHFATTLQIHGHPRGVIVTQNEGRPTHISGNPAHPMSRGATDVWTSASLLDLYDPDRLKNALEGGTLSSWNIFYEKFLPIRNNYLGNGAGLCFLTATWNSPTQTQLIRQINTQFPAASWFGYDPIDFPGSTPTSYDPIKISDADVIFSLESDFLFDRPDSLSLTRAFTQRRQSSDGSQWNRLYVAESSLSITGIKADHRYPVAPQHFERLADALVNAINGGAIDPQWPWLGPLAKDLKNHPGRAVLVAGRSVSVKVRDLFNQGNALLGNPSTPANSSAVFGGVSIAPISELITRMGNNEVQTLFILGGNPLFDLPTDYNFAAALTKVPRTIHHTLFTNETSAQCSWVLNATHDLEAWSDTLAIDGTYSIAQPLIAPFYDGQSVLELLSFLANGVAKPGYDLVRATWIPSAPSPSPATNPPTAIPPAPAPQNDQAEQNWHRWLREGIVRNAAPLIANPAATVPGPQTVSSAAPNHSSSPPTGSSVTLGFRPGHNVWDGSHANNGWLQELPDPVTKLTWENAALFSVKTAKQFNISNGEIVTISTDDGQLDIPALISPGQADDCVTLTLGYGRTNVGSVGTGVGSRAELLRRSDALWSVRLKNVEKTGRSIQLALTQEHFRMEGRDILRVLPISATAPQPDQKEPSSLYPESSRAGHQWAMTINLNSCTGCNACVIACQSENNIPVVGKEQVLMGREMHWIRVDRYYEGGEDNPKAHFQPVTCMHCEKAPCEVVCPVGATQHDSEGLNVMVYNRCVGTRYCSNNCPYKVRRFNFLFYNSDIPETQRLRLNPNVTVRSRGVMEKCTYCVQRIETVRIESTVQNRPFRGEDIVTACQSACPAEAITFGDLSDPHSLVSQNRLKPGHYALLADLDTKPRTTYLEKRVNPNPDLAAIEKEST